MGMMKKKKVRKKKIIKYICIGVGVIIGVVCVFYLYNNGYFSFLAGIGVTMPTLFQALPSDYNSQDYSPSDEAAGIADQKLISVKLLATGSNGLEMHLYPKFENFEGVVFERVEGKAQTAQEQRKAIDTIYNSGVLQNNSSYRGIFESERLERIREIMNNPTPENRAERYIRTSNIVEVYEKVLVMERVTNILK